MIEEKLMFMVSDKETKGEIALCTNIEAALRVCQRREGTYRILKFACIAEEEIVVEERIVQ